MHHKDEWRTLTRLTSPRFTYLFEHILRGSIRGFHPCAKLQDSLCRYKLIRCCRC